MSYKIKQIAKAIDSIPKELKPSAEKPNKPKTKGGYPTSGYISPDDPSIYGHELLGHEGESWASFHAQRAFREQFNK